MWAILTSAEMRQADQATFHDSALPSRAVMEAAGRSVLQVALEGWDLDGSRPVLVLCGPGNNGGDGYVVARGLLERCIPVDVFSLVTAEALKGDAASAYHAFILAGGVVSVCNDDSLETIASCMHRAAVCIDAMFGTGVEQGLREPYRSMVESLERLRHESDCDVLAVDVPSGLDASSGEIFGPAMRATVTVALQALKIPHVQLPAHEVCGEVVLADIGVTLRKSPRIERSLVGIREIAPLVARLFSLKSDAHKGQRGRVCVVGGSPGYFGAPKLSALAASNSGAGVVQLLLPEVAARAVGPELLELTCRGIPSDERGAFLESASSEIAAALSGADAVVLGPGMGTAEGSGAVLRATLQDSAEKKTPTVIDADALTLLANDATLEKLLGRHCILTPHPGEMARLINADAASVQRDRCTHARGLAQRLGCWVLLKGAFSVLSSPEGALKVFPFTEPALACAGSGDILAGILAAVACRAASWEEAALLGVFVHGLCGHEISNQGGGYFAGTAPAILSAISRLLRQIDDPRTGGAALIESVLPFCEGPLESRNE